MFWIILLGRKLEEKFLILGSLYLHRAFLGNRDPVTYLMCAVFQNFPSMFEVSIASIYYHLLSFHFAYLAFAMHSKTSSTRGLAFGFR